MGFSLVGLLLLSVADNYPMILLAAALVGIGSSVFHPEVVARGAHGLGRPPRPRAVAVPGRRQHRLGDRAAARRLHRRAARPGQHRLVLRRCAAGDPAAGQCRPVVQPAPVAAAEPAAAARVSAAYAVLSRRKVLFAIAILVALLFSKNVYTSSLGSYYTFYLIHKFGVSVQDAQIHLFVFLGAVAAGTFAGGPIGDRFGRKPVIWFSILGAFPFALMLPYANLFWTGVLSVAVGLILASAFSAILVYAQELLPGRVGLVAGMFFGFSFGLGGLGAAALGQLADWTSIETVYRLCSFLPLIGLLTAFLPNIERRRG